jgi:DNA polymerase II small subunit
MEKTILKICMEKGFLLDREILGLFSDLEEEDARKLADMLLALKVKEKVITKSALTQNIEKIRNILTPMGNRQIIEKFALHFQYTCAEADLVEKKEDPFYVKVLSSPAIPAKKIEVLDFVNYFRARYTQMRKILEGRNLENLTTIRKIGGSRENYTVIAAVVNKRVTKNKNLMIEIEDPTGKATVLVNQNKKDVFDQAKDLMPDDIAAFQVVGNNEMLFANMIVYPDSFLQDKRRTEEDAWIAFTSDLHVGSKMFLESYVMKFIRWINGEEGDEKQREMARKIKYLFLVGDNIDGVGRYPGQEPFLTIKDARLQYAELARILRMIRPDIKIVMCPGQHDAVWVGEPQPIVGEDWAPDLHQIPNLILVTNPSMIEIIGGFKILMYHGASMNTFIDEIDALRLSNAHDTPARVAKEMLKRRHLAPVHGSVDYVPSEKEDPLIIGIVPDIFATGDQHKADIGTYNNTLLIASACWQSITPFEEKVGNHPDPGKVPLFNLKTRELKILDFSEKDNERANVQGEKVLSGGAAA